MKDRAHHLKQVQRRVLRSARQGDLEDQKPKIQEDNLKTTETKKSAIFDEFVPANQQVPRVGLRHSYH